MTGEIKDFVDRKELLDIADVTLKLEETLRSTIAGALDHLNPSDIVGVIECIKLEIILNHAIEFTD